MTFAFAFTISMVPLFIVISTILVDLQTEEE